MKREGKDEICVISRKPQGQEVRHLLNKLLQLPLMQPNRGYNGGNRRQTESSSGSMGE